MSRRAMTILLLVLLGGLSVLLGAFLLVSPGRPQPFLDENGKVIAGSISEKVFIDVNGARQGMFIKGRDRTHPVLLYLHGDLPDYFLTQQHPTGIDADFTVVWWEQRGSGISYQPDGASDTPTVKQLIADTLTVTDYLRDRFKQDKIYLMGHSGGSFIGIQAAARAPGRFHAYIGVGQMSDQRESERMAHDYMLDKYKERGDATMVKRLQQAPLTATSFPAAYLAIRDAAMHELGIGTMRAMRSLVAGLVIPSLLFREYTFTEKVHLWRGKSGSGISAVWDEMASTDLRKSVPEVAVPVYFLHGRWDYTCNYKLARSYFDALKAPVKGFYSFDQSAHSPLFEEPTRFTEILRRDVRTGRTALADEKRQL